MGGKNPDEDGGDHLDGSQAPEQGLIKLPTKCALEIPTSKGVPAPTGQEATSTPEGVIIDLDGIETDEDPPTNPGAEVFSFRQAQRVANEQRGRVTMDDARGSFLMREGPTAGKGKVLGRVGDPQEDPDDPFEDGEDNTLEPQKGEGLMDELRKLAGRLRRWFVGEPQR